MNLEGEYPRLDSVNEILGSTKRWDYVVIQHRRRGAFRQCAARSNSPTKAFAAMISRTFAMFGAYD